MHQGIQVEFHLGQLGTFKLDTNSIAPRNTGGISLSPTGNSKGGYYFYSLNTGKHLKHYSWTKLPMPADVITRLEELAMTITYDGLNLGQEMYEHDPGLQE